MSKYTTVELEFNDPDCIKDALKELGYVFEEHEEAQHLYGYSGDRRSEKANIIIRRKYVGSAANDVGFLRGQDGKYSMIISEYDRRAGTQSDNFMNKMNQMYGLAKIKKKTKSMGYSIRNQTVTADGKIKIKVFKA